MEETFTLTLDGVDYEIETHGNTFVVNGHPFVIGFEDDPDKRDASSVRVTVDGIAYDIALQGEQAVVDGIAHQFQVSGLALKPTAPTGPARPAPSAAGAGAIRAIMPGAIVRVLATEGDEVAEGDVVLVLEAMKMENELNAPISGVVKAIHVQPGQTVEMNDVLAEIEAPD
ncbi:MAG: biotin/lipoyl-binding protein [Anaerolineae bacterium]|jgi:biotin carboxyl carrier protein